MIDEDKVREQIEKAGKEIAKQIDKEVALINKTFNPLIEVYY